MSFTLFQKLSQIVKVKDLASPLLPDLSPDMTLNEAMNLQEGETGRDFSFHDASLVKKDGEILGWVNFLRLICIAQRGTDEIVAPKFRLEFGEFLHGNLAIRDAMFPVAPSAVISGDTSIFAGADRLDASERPFFFVLEDDLFTGTIAYQHLFRPAFRVCLFALVLELEELVLEWAILHPVPSWNALSEARRQKAIDETMKNQPALQPPVLPRQALEYTLFCDKREIVRKCGLAPKLTAKEIQSLFREAELIRNKCAHAAVGSTAFLPRGRLWPFLKNCHTAIDAIRELLES